VRVAADLHREECIPLEILRTDTPAFEALIESRRNRREKWFRHAVGRIGLCNVPIPVRRREPSPAAPSPSPPEP
jgi:peptidylprolyl isomerase